jgi:hypothetical protein
MISDGENIEPEQFRTNFFRSELDSVFKAGYSFYHTGLVQGVLVADPAKFFAPHHRNHLVCWLPFNEHFEDDLQVADRSALASIQVLAGVAPQNRQFDSKFGWNIRIAPGASILSNKFRALGDATLTFWVKPDAFLVSGTQATILEIGPLSIDLSDTANTLMFYVRNASNVRAQVATASISISDFSFVQLRFTPGSLQYGIGTLTGSSTNTALAVTARSFNDADTLLAVNAGSRGFALHDLRIWRLLKTGAEIDLIRYHSPVPTVVNYRPGVVNVLNSSEQYGMKVLDCGWVTFTPLPAWYRSPKLAQVRRYDSLGRYGGESRFKQVGYGGGVMPPSQYKLGSQFQNLTAVGNTVVSTQHGALPGINRVWSTDTAAGTYTTLLPGGGTFVPFGSNWKYLDNGTDQGSAWRASVFNDGSWASGPGQLGYGDGDEATVISFGPNSNSKYITYYFRGTFQVDSPSVVQNLRMDTVIDDGAAFYMNGTEFYRINLPAGSISYATLAGTNAENQLETVKLNNALLKTGLNVLAVEVHQVGITSSDVSFDLRLYDTGSVLAAVAPSSPWPGPMISTNPNRDRIWVKGDDNFVYEVTLEASGSNSARCVSNKVSRTRNDLELINSGALRVLSTTGSVYTVTARGTIYPGQLLVTAGTSATTDNGAGALISSGQIVGGTLNSATGAVSVLTNGVSQVRVLHPQSLFHVEQPTGALVEVAVPGTILSVTTQGSVYQKIDSGTLTRPPTYLYLNTQLKEQVSGPSLLSRWINPNSFGITNGAPALTGNGELTFANNGTLLPGNYRLKIDSGNIGRTDSEFDGFAVEITVGDTLLDKRLRVGASGSGFRGSDEFEFTLANKIVGDWLLSVQWTNELTDPARGTARQLAIYGYELRQLATSLFKLSIAASGTIPDLTPVYTAAFTGSTPGGWLVEYNSYGTVKNWRHEASIYPSNDTLTSKLPVSDLLTGRTAERREDILITNAGSLYFVLPDTSDPVFSSFGTGVSVL